MSLFHFTSKSNEQLAKKLAENIKLNDSVFAPHFIITSHNATNDWLTSVVANENKISAHIFYKQPQQFIEMVYSVLEARVSNKELINPNQMVWIIDAILDDDDFKKRDEHKKVTDYIGGNHLKRFTLAEKTADLFQKYQEINPEIIIKWNDDLLTDKGEDEIWQKYIWNKLTSLTNSKLPDLTRVYESIKTALKDATKTEWLKAKIPFVTFYGNHSYTKELLDLLKDLSEFISISIYRQVLLDTDTSNHRLTENFGVISKKYNELFSGIDSIVIKQEENIESNTLLKAIQSDVFGSSHNYKSSIDSDDSLIISNCFSVNREVEALYHYLVKQFESNPGLMMREVCVLVKDIDLYAPAVKAFFSQKPFDIDFTFYDSSHRVHESPYLALHTLLNFDAENFTSKQVMGLLDYSFIRKKFDFQEDLNDLYRAVNLANIRHGMDGDKNLETDYVSWRYGLKRLIYGFCLAPNSGEVTFGDASFYPIDQFEDRQTLELLKLYEFTEVLNHWLEVREQSRTLTDWGKFIEEDTIQFFLNMKEYETNKFTRLLSDMSASDDFRNGNTVEYTTIRYYFNSKLENLESGEKTGYGGVRFVSPNANLSSPAQIYAFLGMNGGDFPRRSTRLSFDLSDKDQVTSTDADKNLFLNLILSAQSKCYLSYIGQSIKDNSSIPPSTVIDELLAAAEKYFPTTLKNTDDFIVKHPLHSFSKKYNSKEFKNSLFQYSVKNSEKQLWLKEKDKQLEETNILEKEDGKTVIQLNDLIRFLEDPIRHYYNKVLGIYYNDREVNLDEVEPFELDNLGVWGIKDLLLNERLKGNENFEGFRESLVKKGKLPFKSFGEKIITNTSAEIEAIVSNLSQYSNQTSTEKKINIEVGNFIIKGSVSSVYNSSLLYATVSKTSLKRIVQALASYSAIKLNDPTVKNLHYVSIDKKGMLNLDEESIKKLLIDWCELFEKGTGKMVLFSSSMDKPDKRNEINKFDDLNIISGFNDFLQSKIDDQNSKTFFSDYFMKEFSKDAFVSIENCSQFIKTYKKIVEDIAPLEEALA
jgi:exodeoxyribonuclease V gamma subunit